LIVAFYMFIFAVANISNARSLSCICCVKLMLSACCRFIVVVSSPSAVAACCLLMLWPLPPVDMPHDAVAIADRPALLAGDVAAW